jgi:hypothetical protein
MKTRKISLFLASILLVLGMVSLNACKKDKAKLPQIGGYDNSDQVAATNLKAHWTFDGTNNEDISSTAPATANGASFITGIKGQALHLANGYLLYPTIAALSTANAISSVTVSLWINVDNNGANGTVSSFFALTQPVAVQADWNQGPLNIYAETNKKLAYDDTLVLHSAFHTYLGGNYNTGGDNINDYGIRGTDFQTVLGAKKWVHYVMQYDGSGSNIDLYANGVRVSNNNFRHRATGTPPVGIGPIIINPPTQVLIGAFPNADAGYALSAAQVWQGKLTGSIDEIRVYNKVLTPQEIGSLYQLELAGR